MTADPARREGLRTRLEQVRDRLARAEQTAGRERGEVDLVVVTKFFPASDVRHLISLGERVFGESREPEAGRKVDEVARGLTGSAADVSMTDLAFDMIGSVQTKKARTVARWARRVHSVDRDRLVTALDSATTSAREDHTRSEPLGVLLQINLDGDPTRGGVLPDELPALADLVVESVSLRLDGLMVIAPQSHTPEHWMEQTARHRERFVERYPQAKELSAGMSGDFETAIAHGSTCVRVGTAIMGDRPLISH